MFASAICPRNITSLGFYTGSLAWQSPPGKFRRHASDRYGVGVQILTGDSHPPPFSSLPFRGGEQFLVVGLRLFSLLSSTLTLGLLTELRSFEAPGL